jgi:hypothetical protein
MHLSLHSYQLGDVGEVGEFGFGLNSGRLAVLLGFWLQPHLHLDVLMDFFPSVMI